MLMLIVLLLTHQVAGQFECPQVTAASFGDDLDFTSFSAVLLDQPEGVVVDGSASDGGQCKLYNYVIICIYRPAMPSHHQSVHGEYT